jgi:alkanesulfonate monooxygenase SsuD/methylene tetrahydromethanopterin reductase-like flavin-dependent oxidoreductase (luciferase family)
MKLAVFGLNVSSAGGMTRARDRHEIDWQQNVRLVKLAEDAGFEAAVPFARWRGFEGESNPWGESYETYTWAAGLAAVTSRIAVFSTSHIFTMSPIMAAKQISTIDHISGGRVALNTVSGWFAKEIRMFTADSLDHDARYAYADEWMEIVARLWTETDTFDFSGAYLTVKSGYQQPKSIQKPRPPVMSAGLSAVGNAFAARWADMVFVSPDKLDPKSAKEKVDALRSLAAERGRRPQVWIAASVEAAPTAAQAHATVAHFVEQEGDAKAMENFLEWIMGGSHMTPERRKSLIESSKEIGRGYPIVGTPRQVADEIHALSEAGIDGLCLTWFNYEAGMPYFIREVLPLLEKSGLRQAIAR